jgi:hypothetical protein
MEDFSRKVKVASKIAADGCGIGAAILLGVR